MSYDPALGMHTDPLDDHDPDAGTDDADLASRDALADELAQEGPTP